MATKKQAAPKEGATKSTARKAAPQEDRQALNDKARYDYGIVNAEDMSTEQVKAEMKAVDAQLKDGEAERKAAEKNA